MKRISLIFTMATVALLVSTAAFAQAYFQGRKPNKPRKARIELVTPPGPVICYKYAFVSSRDGWNGLYLGDTCLDEPPSRILSVAGEMLKYPSFSPDGTKIAYGSPRLDITTRLLIKLLNSEYRDSRGFIIVPLGNDENGDGNPDYYPRWPLAWSGDGSQIVFVALETPTVGLVFCPVIMHDPTPYDPEGAVKIVDNFCNSDEFQMDYTWRVGGDRQFEKVEWSPTTNTEDDSFNHLLFSVKEGEEPFRISSYDFTEHREESLYELYRVSGDNVKLEGREPSFSKPDGSKLAFVRTKDGNDQIFVCNLDFSVTWLGWPVPSANRCTEPRPLTSEGNNTSPSWSPDGEHIFFTSGRDGNKEIYRMKADGTEQTRLTNNTAVDEMPTVHPISYTRP